MVISMFKDAHYGETSGAFTPESERIRDFVGVGFKGIGSNTQPPKLTKRHRPFTKSAKQKPVEAWLATPGICPWIA